MFFKKNNSKQSVKKKSEKIKKLAKRIRELEKSRNNWKDKYKKVKENMINYKKKLQNI